MRLLRPVLCLLVVTSSFFCLAAEKPAPPPIPGAGTALLQGPEGIFQFHVLPPGPGARQFSFPDRKESALGRLRLHVLVGGPTCYHIRSYKRKRLDNSDETVPAGMTTCTPSSRLRVLPAIP